MSDLYVLDRTPFQIYEHLDDQIRQSPEHCYQRRTRSGSSPGSTTEPKPIPPSGSAKVSIAADQHRRTSRPDPTTPSSDLESVLG